MRWQELGLVDFLASIAPADDVYGGYDLQVGDLDAGEGGVGAPRYGGRSRSADAGDPLPAAGEPGFVAQLRRDSPSSGSAPRSGSLRPRPATRRSTSRSSGGSRAAALGEAPEACGADPRWRVAVLGRWARPGRQRMALRRAGLGHRQRRHESADPGLAREPPPLPRRGRGALVGQEGWVHRAV